MSARPTGADRAQDLRVRPDLRAVPSAHGPGALAESEARAPDAGARCHPDLAPLRGLINGVALGALLWIVLALLVLAAVRL